jgi:hypothetical protein
MSSENRVFSAACPLGTWFLVLGAWLLLLFPQSPCLPVSLSSAQRVFSIACLQHRMSSCLLEFGSWNLVLVFRSLCLQLCVLRRSSPFTFRPRRSTLFARRSTPNALRSTHKSAVAILCSIIICVICF